MTTETVAELKARIQRESEAALELLKLFGLHGKWTHCPSPSETPPQSN